MMPIHFCRRAVVAAVLLAVPVLILSGGGTAATPIPILILAGQSNMVGRGEPVSEGTGPVAGLMQWDNDRWEAAADPLGPANEEQGVGPGMTLGIEVLSHLPPGSTLGLIMCARGESSIGNWQSGGDLYQQCKHFVKKAGGHVIGIAFLQGEKEAGLDGPAGPDRWGKTFPKVEQQFQRDFGPVPFVLGQIGNVALPNAQAVRDVQAAAAVGHGEISLVPSADLPMTYVHYTLDAYKQLGTRFGQAWYSLFLKTPAIDSLLPNVAPVGGTVTIEGAGLDLVSEVKIGGDDASFTIHGEDQITAVVPANAVTGTVEVRSPLGAPEAPIAVPPTIASLSPVSAPTKSRVFVTGTTFKGTSQATIGGVPVAFKVMSNTTLRLTVSGGVTSGKIAVTNAGGTAVSIGTFSRS